MLHQSYSTLAPDVEVSPAVGIMAAAGASQQHLTTFDYLVVINIFTSECTFIPDGIYVTINRSVTLTNQSLIR